MPPQFRYPRWLSLLYIDEAQYRVRIARTKPMVDDVVYCREGARSGNAARITGGIEPALGQDSGWCCSGWGKK
jgi:hypothetical protein